MTVSRFLRKVRLVDTNSHTKSFEDIVELYGNKKKADDWNDWK